MCIGTFTVTHMIIIKYLISVVVSILFNSLDLKYIYAFLNVIYVLSIN